MAGALNTPECISWGVRHLVLDLTDGDSNAGVWGNSGYPFIAILHSGREWEHLSFKQRLMLNLIVWNSTVLIMCKQMMSDWTFNKFPVGRRLLKIQCAMRWLNFHDFSCKWTASAGIEIHPTKTWLSQLVNFKNAIWTWGHFKRTICNKILF